MSISLRGRVLELKVTGHFHFRLAAFSCEQFSGGCTWMGLEVYKKVAEFFIFLLLRLYRFRYNIISQQIKSCDRGTISEAINFGGWGKAVPLCV